MGLIHTHASKKRDRAEAKLATAERKQVKKEGAATRQADRQDAQAERHDAQTAKWEPIVAAMEAGEQSYDDLSFAEKMSVPFRYSRRVMAVRKAAKNAALLPAEAALEAEASVADRLHALAALHEQGLVTDEEFAARREAMLDEATS